MQVSNPNNVKIYNLSSGKSLPEWLSDKKRRKLMKKNVDLRRRIELIQNFDMPAVSTSVKVSNDGQYILSTGIYKPRLKCFDVHNLSLKFERCFDSEVVNFQILSDDYSKLVFLHCDRTIEFHAAPGKYYRLRIPRFGRDITYHYPSCDVIVVGDSNEIYRLNLERGQFLKPYESESMLINKCCVNPAHHLLVIGTQDGKVEAWDPRTKNKVGTLDCAIECMSMQQHDDIQNLQKLHLNGPDTELSNLAVTALNFQGALNMAVGTSTGQILLYDIRSNKPYLIKDHMYGLPIKNIQFHNDMNHVYSMDSSIVKIWEKDTGKLYTSIEANAQTDFNDLCTVPNTGMLFLANEAPKMCIYYIPSLGPAPSWASFLDNLTEELEELNFEIIYDDYKFVTHEELDELGLTHLAGTNLLRAYMHGYFIDIRLWTKAKQIARPFSFEEYKKKKIQEKISEERVGRLKKIQEQKQIDLPPVNKELAAKYREITIKSQQNNSSSSKAANANILMKDNRFKALFTNPDYQIDINSEEYSNHAIVKAAVSKKLQKMQAKKGLKSDPTMREDNDSSDDNNYVNYTMAADCKQSDDELFDNDDDDDDGNSSRGDKSKQSDKRTKIEGKYRNKWKIEETIKNKNNNQGQKTEIKRGSKLRVVEMDEGWKYMQQVNDASLGERLKSRRFGDLQVVGGSRGNKEATFTIHNVHKKRKFMKK